MIINDIPLLREADVDLVEFSTITWDSLELLFEAVGEKLDHYEDLVTSEMAISGSAYESDVDKLNAIARYYGKIQDEIRFRLDDSNDRELQ